MYRPHFSPALVLAALALFLAAGGSGYALGHKAAAPQPRCAAGAVRGIAVVTGDPLKGIENLSGDYSSAAKLFGYRFNCSGRAVQVRKAPSLTSVDVRFVGNASRIAIVNAIGSDPAGVSVAPQPDGSFRVSLASRSDQPDGNSFGPKALGFVIVAL
jgi:hypothetical protein